MIYVIFWTLCGLLGAATLSRFNKAGIGCLLGGLLGPIGLAVALFVRTQEAKAEEEQRRAEEKRRHEELVAARRSPAPRARRDQRDCPFCAEPILTKARVCKHCGRDVEPVA